MLKIMTDGAADMPLEKTAASLPTAEALDQKLCSAMNVNVGMITDLAIPIAANLGPGAVGVSAYPVADDFSVDGFHPVHQEGEN